MINRFKMSFNNSGYIPQQFNVSSSLASIGSKSVLSSSPKIIPLNASMIDRVHKAKPGCSACGKKIA